jgi:polyhydroxyalkanoate synthase
MQKAKRKVAKTTPKDGVPPANDTASVYAIGDGAEFVRNMMRVGVQSQQLLTEFAKRQLEQGNAPADPLNLTDTFMALARGMAAHPAALIDAQFQLWRDAMGLWEAAAHRMLGGTPQPVAAPSSADKRFRDKDWQENQIFDFIKQSYLLTANWLQNTVANVEGLDPVMRRRADFYTKQFVDAIAPSNFVLTNPEVLRTTMRTNGENLVRGLDNLLADLERGHGQLAIRQSGDGFVVGENIALTQGKVVFRCELFELLQYAPATAEVRERPLLIFPPWINKFYILDLRPENSFIKWLVGQGYTVFVVSWVNPGRELNQKSFEDYMREGIFAALDAVEKATGVRDPNVVGYCIGGTLLGGALAYMAKTGDTRVHSATFWAAQVDFSEAGDLKIFVDDAQLAALKEQMDADGGLLEGRKMATTFNMLRANDLIWSFVVSNYLLGKTPAPFDLLFWNSDSTRMPEKMHLFYLSECYRDNALALGKMKFGDVKLDLTKVKVPVYLQSAKEDHIAPFVSVYKATKLFKGPIRFIVAGSGHIAGVINPPAGGKYQYWTNDKLPATVEEWQAGGRGNIPVPGGPTGTNGWPSIRARKSPRENPATAS